MTFRRLPRLGGQELDLYRMFHEVVCRGGCDAVVRAEGTWANIFRSLDNYTETETSASFRLKKLYRKYLLGFEHAVAHALVEEDVLPFTIFRADGGGEAFARHPPLGPTPTRPSTTLHHPPLARARVAGGAGSSRGAGRAASE